ncbi:MAG TPA: hypothetical protein VGJ66_18020 [Pyrinomonadaceae bacterium]
MSVLNNSLYGRQELLPKLAQSLEITNASLKRGGQNGCRYPDDRGKKVFKIGDSITLLRICDGRGSCVKKKASNYDDHDEPESSYVF